VKKIKVGIDTTDHTFHQSNTGGGMRCGNCLKSFKSFLQLKAHKANEHGEQNEFSHYTQKEMSRGERQSRRKERLYISEEKLKEEISKFKQTR